MSRAEKAGRLLGRALVEIIHLMYQENTAGNFIRGLIQPLLKEQVRREKGGANARKK